MIRTKKILSSVHPISLGSRLLYPHEEAKLLSLISSQFPSQWTSNRFLDIYQIGNKAAIEKERARLKDEMSRGYLADFAEMKKHGGKISMANKIIIPAMAAVKFPTLEVNYWDNSSLELPVTFNISDTECSKQNILKASLLCLSFRASSQAMIDSWSMPFLSTFRNSEEVQLYEVSFIDSWLLSLNPIKKLLLRMMKKSKPDGSTNMLQRQIVYSFGDYYYFRKELKLLNLLTGYVFLVDKFGRIRWQGCGLATEEELSSLMSCTSHLLEEE